MRRLVKATEAWTSDGIYSIEPLYGIASDKAYFACPVVTYSGVSYIAQNPTFQPVVGVTPVAAPLVWSVYIADSSGTIVTPFIPTFTCDSAGDLDVTYTERTGTIRVIGKEAFIYFHVSGSFTNTTGTGGINIIAPELDALNTAGYVRASFEYLLKNATLHTAGYTSYVAYFNGNIINVEAQSTDPVLPNIVVQVEDVDPAGFSLQGQIIVPLN